jgi:chromosome segregation ATPase
MGSTPLVKQVLIGMLLGVFIAPPQTAQAQWTVFDPTNYAAKLEEMMREVQRWQETIDHYTKMYDKAVQQVSSLGGILKTVDQQLARNKELVSSVAYVGRTIRQIYQMKRQIEAMVTCRIRAIRSMHTRMKAGIFNPQQDLQDLEEYLRNSIGRSSQDTVANIERLANMDNEFERLRYELQLAWGRLAEAEGVLNQYEAMLNAEMQKPEEERHSAALLQTQITNTKIQIEQIKTQINDLTAKIVEKSRKYGVQLTMRADYGQQVESTTKAWDSTVPARQEILKRIDQEFEPDARFDDDPADGGD